MAEFLLDNLHNEFPVLKIMGFFPFQVLYAYINSFDSHLFFKYSYHTKRKIVLSLALKFLLTLLISQQYEEVYHFTCMTAVKKHSVQVFIA